MPPAPEKHHKYLGTPLLPPPDRTVLSRGRCCPKITCIINMVRPLHLTLGLILEWISYFQDQRPLHVGPLHEQQLFFIVNDLCRFILHEVVHIGGEFVHPEHELSLDPKYASLRQWENQELRAGSTSVSQCK